MGEPAVRQTTDEKLNDLLGGDDPALQAVLDGQPQIEVSDVSATEGSTEGGTAVWLLGAGFTADLTVRFGGVPAPSVTVCSPSLIKCVSPPYTPLVEQRRHEVQVQLVSGLTGAGVTVPTTFSYTTPPPPRSPVDAHPQLLPRLLGALERAETMASGLPGTSPFDIVDEHGASLAECAAPRWPLEVGRARARSSSSCLTLHRARSPGTSGRCATCCTKLARAAATRRPSCRRSTRSSVPLSCENVLRRRSLAGRIPTPCGRGASCRTRAPSRSGRRRW